MIRSALLSARGAVDRLVGRVTMTLLIIGALAAIALLALVLSAAGVLYFSPVEWLLSLIVALAATIGASWLAALLVRATPHLPSSVITALLLFLIFTPSAQTGSIAAIAIAGAAAGASKFLIAPLGRHLLNPAAFGALLVGVLQSVIPDAPLAYASWWVATPPLLPLVALGAIAVLWRTSTLGIGVAFTALTAAVVITRMTLSGLELGAAAALALGSLPIVFFAGFMLSEPLTLPRRRWQRLLEVVVVAVAFGIPFQLGPVFSSPELALVIGNLLAFGFALAGRTHGSIRLRLESRRELAPGTWELAFLPVRPVRFEPGQAIELSVPVRRGDARGSRRVFSIASAPHEELVRIAFTVPQTGRVSALKSALLDLEPGASLRATGVSGDFVLPARAATPVLLVAGGIGITPFVSQLRAAAARGLGHDAVLVVATSTTGRPVYADELAATEVPVVLFAPAAPASLPDGWTYAGAGRPDADRIGNAVPDLRSRVAYVSGPPAMVSGLGAALRRAGVRRLRRDVFSGY